ncbi:helix-turn-helix domain-containing protein [Mammaliicoccus sciuri]|uniref:helix-turn-helix domain-containing protein n=2 Tax=Bacillales TaxID=1385 RepID=UPI001F2BFE99|nr:helix-turn-helix transcriptional regulator [Mammaliicoccus sciuri]
MTYIMISKQIKDLRKQHNYTQEDLAEKLNTSRQTISKWEQGISEPDLNMLMQLSLLFSVSTDYLIIGSDNIIKKDNKNYSYVKYCIVN